MKLKLNYLIMAGAVCFTANALAGGIDNMPKKTAAPRKFIDPANMDPTVRPGDDFFEYANGGWLKRNTIPDKETSWGSFLMLRDDNKKKLLGIVEEASKAV